MIFALLALALADASLAQSATDASRLSDDWKASKQPAPAGSTAYGAMPQKAADGESGHFKFKQRAGYKDAPGNAAQAQSGKAPVMGRSVVGSDGRPAVNCVNTPRDPACR
ncbi:hypothetical protein ASG87_08380 [Frateuria sp. Soil773]|nr:hypothetical protein ASG87_08380 [Frateuria sp. Soil773]